MAMWRVWVTLPDHAEKVGLMVDAADAATATTFISTVWGKWPEGTTFTAAQFLA